MAAAALCLSSPGSRAEKKTMQMFTLRLSVLPLQMFFCIKHPCISDVWKAGDVIITIGADWSLEEDGPVQLGGEGTWASEGTWIK